MMLGGLSWAQFRLFPPACCIRTKEALPRTPGGVGPLPPPVRQPASRPNTMIAIISRPVRLRIALSFLIEPLSLLPLVIWFAYEPCFFCLIVASVSQFVDYSALPRRLLRV